MRKYLVGKDNIGNVIDEEIQNIEKYDSFEINFEGAADHVSSIWGYVGDTAYDFGWDNYDAYEGFETDVKNESYDIDIDE